MVINLVNLCSRESCDVKSCTNTIANIGIQVFKQYIKTLCFFIYTNSEKYFQEYVLMLNRV